MPVSAAVLQWIKLRLPKGTTTLTKNGVVVTLDAAIETSLADNDDDQALALADILDILAADATFDAETIGDYSYSGPNLMARAKEIRGGGTSGAFQFVPARFEPNSNVDEFAGGD